MLFQLNDEQDGVSLEPSVAGRAPKATRYEDVHGMDWPSLPCTCEDSCCWAVVDSDSSRPRLLCLPSLLVTAAQPSVHTGWLEQAPDTANCMQCPSFEEIARLRNWLRPQLGDAACRRRCELSGRSFQLLLSVGMHWHARVRCCACRPKGSRERAARLCATTRWLR